MLRVLGIKTKKKLKLKKIKLLIFDNGILLKVMFCVFFKLDNPLDNWGPQLNPEIWIWDWVYYVEDIIQVDNRITEPSSWELPYRHK